MAAFGARCFSLSLLAFLVARPGQAALGPAVVSQIIVPMSMTSGSRWLYSTEKTRFAVVKLRQTGPGRQSYTARTMFSLTALFDQESTLPGDVALMDFSLWFDRGIWRYTAYLPRDHETKYVVSRTTEASTVGWQIAFADGYGAVYDINEDPDADGILTPRYSSARGGAVREAPADVRHLADGSGSQVGTL